MVEVKNWRTVTVVTLMLVAIVVCIAISEGCFRSSKSDSSGSSAYGAATNLAFTTQPVTTVAGATMASVVVTVRDAYNNTVTSASTVVTLTPSAGTLYGTVSKTASSGIATFNAISMTLAGSGYTFITSNNGGLTNTTSTAFNITTAPLDHYVVVVPATVITNTNQTGTVKAQDVYNNDLTSAATTVTMTRNVITGTPATTLVTFYTSATYATPTTTYAYIGGTQTFWFRAVHDGTVPDTVTITATDVGAKTGTSANMNITN